MMKDFILQHRNEDVRKVALLGNRNTNLDMQFALNQIAGWQTARTKLPSWAEHDDIVYPPHISMEQCSSEQTARYKASLAKGRTMVDLTGGFGVDFSFIARNFDEATYVEQQNHLCEIAKKNFGILGLSNIHIVCGDSVEYLHKMQHVDCIYLDPARRDQHGAKTYAIEDCTPNVIELKDLLLEKADRTIIKLSPMLDWHNAIEKLQHVTEVHIISVSNECKETLVIMEKKSTKPSVFCVNDNQITVFDFSDTPVRIASKQALLTSAPLILIPNASIMKSGLFGQLCTRYDITAIGKSSNIFITDNIETASTFPGRAFRIIQTSTMNKRELKEALAGITHANIAVRNFPMSVDELRKRLKVKDGGSIYIFATTLMDGTHSLLFCEKVNSRHQ